MCYLDFHEMKEKFTGHLYFRQQITPHADSQLRERITLALKEISPVSLILAYTRMTFAIII